MQMTQDIKNALQDLHGHSEESVEEAEDGESHIFLILDDALQGIPWESISILQGKSVSRIPSLSFLQDKLDMIDSWPRKEKVTSEAEDVRKDSCLTADARKVFYILNPEGDLKNTQNEFEGYLQGMQENGWNGIVGRPPMALEMKRSLESHDLLM